ncbi:hypothetical protein HY409_01950 [Candidatus Gottesmanbacteria bacterium]|nr:hypothetical protein [Candidatus Gottesmanbacteria bacterium]
MRIESPIHGQTVYHIGHTDGRESFIGVNASKDLPGHKITEATGEQILDSIKKLELPLAAYPTSVVGWGGCSVAVRIKSSEVDENTVAVFSALPESEGKPDFFRATTLWSKQQQVASEFSPMVPKQNMVIVDGVDGRPMMMKLSKEIPGDTLMSLSPLYVLGNETLLRQWGVFCRKVISYFRKHQVTIDVDGRLLVTPRSGISWIFPLDSCNLIGTYGSNELALIDPEVNPYDKPFNKADTYSKRYLIKRLIGLAAGAVGSDLLSHIYLLRNANFDRKTKATYIEKQLGDAEYQKFVNRFGEIIKTLEQNGINYRVIGGMAIAGYLQTLGEDYHTMPYRPNHTARDVDVLVLDQPTDSLQKILTSLKKEYPEVSLTGLKTLQEALAENDIIRKDLYPHKYSRIVQENGEFLQVYGEISTPLTTADIEAVHVNYDGLKIKTLRPEVLAGLYLTRGGAIKFKDLPKIERLYKVAPFRMPDNFIDFSRSMRSTYPTYYRNFLLWELYYYLIGQV